MNTALLRNNALFEGMSGEEINEACSSLDARIKAYRRGESVICAGEPTDRLGIVLSGSVTIENNDMWGNRTVLGIIGKNGIFAETYAVLKNEPVSVDVTANEDARIASFNVRRLMEQDHASLVWESKMIHNLLKISMYKNLLLSRRSFHISSKSIRGRIMSYLNTVSLQKHANEFDIPFDRQQLADYLNVDRTALSRELGRMRNEGILSFKKNHFILQEEARK